MEIAVVKYNAGNVESVLCALERMKVKTILTDNEAEIRAADKVIFPGVGEASTAMRYLREANLHELIPTLKQPVLGICLGLQLMCRYSEENATKCLNIFPLDVKRFVAPEGSRFKIPHMGWNNIHSFTTPLFNGLPEIPYVYFVHSFYAELGEGTAAIADYILPFSAALHKDNFYATQFHPEKSGDIGEQILRNFIELT